jgi:hypothetical protein
MVFVRLLRRVTTLQLHPVGGRPDDLPFPITPQTTKKQNFG